MAVDNDTLKMSIGERIRELMEKYGISKSDISRETGIPAASFGYIIDGATYNPRIDTLIAIAKYFGISLDTLVGYSAKSSEKQVKPVKQVAYKNTTPSPETAPRVPWIDWKDVRFWLKHGNDFLKNNFHRWVLISNKLSPEAFALDILYQGQGIFPKGTILIVDPQAPYDASDYVLVSIRSNAPSIKKLYREQDQFYLNSVGLTLASEPVNDDNKIIGKIVEYRVSL